MKDQLVLASPTMGVLDLPDPRQAADGATTWSREDRHNSVIDVILVRVLEVSENSKISY
jgi:hypothetical protein